MCKVYFIAFQPDRFLPFFLPEEYEDINNSENRQNRGNSSKHIALFCFNVDC